MTRADEHGYGELRRAVVGGLRGRVLEVGCGTGAMFETMLPAFPMIRVEAHKPAQGA